MSVDGWWSQWGKNFRKKAHPALSSETHFIYYTITTWVRFCFCHLTRSIYLTAWIICSVQWQPWPGSTGPHPTMSSQITTFPKGRNILCEDADVSLPWALFSPQSILHTLPSIRVLKCLSGGEWGSSEGITQPFWLVSL